MWYKSILPTTFPFVVVCNLLIYYDGITLYSKFLGPLICHPLGLSPSSSFPMAASILCGYPLGAKYCDDIYSIGYINRREYLRLLNIASNVGPIFLLGSVGATMLHNSFYGYILLLSSYVSIIFIGIITKKSRTINKNTSTFNIQNTNFNMGAAIKSSIENAISTILSIGGFIVIFSIIIELIKKSLIISSCFNRLELLLSLPHNCLYSLFLGSIEITNGCSLISNSDMPISYKLSAISFLCSFSGFAIIAQVSSFVNKSNINFKYYISLKFIQGIFSAFFTFLVTTSLPITAMSMQKYTYNTPYKITYFFIPLLVLLLTYMLLYALNQFLFH